jgi:hypothetical protein
MFFSWCARAGVYWPCALEGVGGVESNPENCGSNPDEALTQSFIVKVWLEERPPGKAGARWRGHVTHVPGGERVHVKSLQEITVYISRFLRGMGVKVGFSWRFWAWILGNRK